MAFALAAMAFMASGSAQAQDTRSLNLLHKHTGEELYVTYKRWGKYDAEALKKLNWFLRDWRKDEPTTMDPKLFDVIWEVYRAVGAQAPIHVVSAYRSASTNAMLRRRSRAVARASQHIMGKAMDFYIPGVSMPAVRAAGLQLQRGGVGFYPGSANLFVHMDSGSVRHWPKVSRDYLTRLFPDGRTVHIPADGKPMPGYDQALASVLARGGTVAGFGGGEAGESDAPTTGGGGFFAALFGIRPQGADEQIRVPQGRRGRAAPVAVEPPPEPATAMATAKKQDEVAEAARSTPRMANVPMPLPAPSAQERLNTAVSQIAFAPMPLARPEEAKAAFAVATMAVPQPQPPPASPEPVAMAAAPLPPSRATAKPQVLPDQPLPDLIAAGEQRMSGTQVVSAPQAALGFAALPSTAVPQAAASVTPLSPTVPPPVTPPAMNAMTLRQQTQPAHAAPPVRRSAPTPLVPPSTQGNRGRTLLIPDPTPTTGEGQMARPNPAQLKLIEQPDVVVAQSFNRGAVAMPPSGRFSGRAVAAVKTVSFGDTLN